MSTLKGLQHDPSLDVLAAGLQHECKQYGELAKRIFALEESEKAHRQHHTRVEMVRTTIGPQSAYSCHRCGCQCCIYVETVRDQYRRAIGSFSCPACGAEMTRL